MNTQTKSKSRISAFLAALLIYNILGFSIFIGVVLQISPNGSNRVYITATGECYHKGSCKYLKHSKFPSTIEEAVNKGLRRCKYCEPPRYISKEDYGNRMSHLSSAQILFKSAGMTAVFLAAGSAIFAPILIMVFTAEHIKLQFITGYIVLFKYVILLYIT